MFGMHYTVPLYCKFCIFKCFRNNIEKIDLSSFIVCNILAYLCDRICTQQLFLLQVSGQLLVFLSDLAVLLF